MADESMRDQAPDGAVRERSSHGHIAVAWLPSSLSTLPSKRVRPLQREAGSNVDPASRAPSQEVR
jgi:hypothetical protein